MVRLRTTRRRRLRFTSRVREANADGVPEGTIRHSSDRRAPQVREDRRRKPGFDGGYNRPMDFGDHDPQKRRQSGSCMNAGAAAAPGLATVGTW